MITDAEIEIELQRLKDTTLPFKVDLTDKVMSVVCAKPNLRVVRRNAVVRRWAVGVAASVALVLAVGATLMYTSDYNGEQVGDMLASVYSYQNSFDNSDIDSPVFEFVEDFCSE